MIGQKDESMDLDRIESLSASKDPNYDRLKIFRGLEQKATLYCATSHLNEGASVGNEA